MNAKLLIPLLFLFMSSLQAQETSSSILDDAYHKAKTEGKNVWILFTASWCEDCKSLAENLQDGKIINLIEANYILVPHIVKESKGKRHLETPGANLLLNNYMGKKAGLPFWLIFDKNRGLIGNSYGERGKNMGSPSNDKEIEDFKNVIRKTSNLNEEELVLIGEVFLNSK